MLHQSSIYFIDSINPWFSVLMQICAKVMAHGITITVEIGDSLANYANTTVVVEMSTSHHSCNCEKMADGEKVSLRKVA